MIKNGYYQGNVGIPKVLNELFDKIKFVGCPRNEAEKKFFESNKLNYRMYKYKYQDRMRINVMFPVKFVGYKVKIKVEGVSEND